MRRRKNKLLFFIILLISVGFAALAVTLSINGNLHLASASWNIYFDNISFDQTLEEKYMPVISSDNIVTFNAYIEKNKEYFFNFDVVNDSSIDAMIKKVDLKLYDDDDNEVVIPSYIDYSLQYENGVDLGVNQLLKKNDLLTIYVNLKYSDDFDIINVGDGVGYNFEFEIEYVNATKDAYDIYEALPRLVNGYEFNKLYSQTFINDSNNKTGSWSAFTALRKADSMPNEYRTNHNKISASDSALDAYGWCEEHGICYYYSDYPKIKLNEDSSNMFANIWSLTETDLSGFDTSEVTNMAYMFSYSLVKEIDLSNFDFSNVQNFNYMFEHSSAEKIYTSCNLNINSNASSVNMFKESLKLSGGNGTDFDKAIVSDLSYASVDGYSYDSENGVCISSDNVGYFTLKS